MSDTPDHADTSPARLHDGDDAEVTATIPEEAENIEAEEQRDVERLEQEALQRPDPAADDLPDRAFDRITPGV
ncbi:hypothetical protein Sa4125_10130 [Aureimonas sp. SA4125]|uniref:hypothetical protein n=1 Tax=Aureimonas sp. SA4125 TaxID=2826993 RepID=UPI001CC451FB|nr:hypothetical protein [Aureimonas sp. SA4125]BDA83471.1 hypothetical protein Sa4125_10130 [Aureimonas sp. SA4125]